MPGVYRNGTEKYGSITIAQSDQITTLFGTTLTYGGCVGGLIFLWALFRIMVVVSLALQDRSCQIKDSMDTRNIDLQVEKKTAVNPNASFM